MRGIVLAGGTGSRLSPLTLVTNKHLLPVYDEPMIFRPIATLRDSGIRDITIVLGGESVGDFVRLLGNGEILGVSINYVYQKGAGGIAEALHLTKAIVEGHDLAVILGDNIFQDAFPGEIAEFEHDSDHGNYLFLKQVEDPQRFGVANVDNQGKISHIVEKPTQPESNWVVTGLYLYRADVFDRIQRVIDTIGYSHRGELEITDVNNLYVREGKSKAILVKNFWSDAGSFDTLLRSSNFLQRLKKGTQGTDLSD
jgi:glucose-1-phosphate thymidylyltransferase